MWLWIVINMYIIMLNNRLLGSAAGDFLIQIMIMEMH